MDTVTIHKAKTELSKLLQRVENGEEIVISRGNTPVAVLKSVATAAPPAKLRKPGAMKHLLGKIPEAAFSDPLSEDALKLWEGGD